MEILLVEASFSEARTAFDVLERGNVRCRVSLVRDAAEAVAFLQRKSIFARAPRPDLILLAADLPMHGSYEVFSSIRNDEKLKAIPTVVLSDKALSPAQSSAVCTSTTDILPGESSGLTDVS